MKSRIKALNEFNRRERIRAKVGQYLLLILLILWVYIEVQEIMKPNVITIISPTIVEVTKIKEEKIETVEPVKKPSIDEIVYKIYRLESSAGINDSCKSRGLFNGYGYAIYEGSYRCFESHDQITKIVTAWVEKNQNLSTAQMLCKYNTGQATEGCEYYQKFLSL